MVSYNCLEKEQEVNMSVTTPKKQNTEHGIKLLFDEEDSLAKLSQKNGLPALTAKFQIQIKVRI